MWLIGAEAPRRGQSGIATDDLGSTAGFLVQLPKPRDKARLASHSFWHVTAGARTKPVWFAAAILTATWVSTTNGYAEWQDLQLSSPTLRPNAAMADFDRTTREGQPRPAQITQPVNTTAVQLAQAKTGDTEELRQALAQEQRKVQTLARDLRTSRQEMDSVLGLLQHVREQWLSITEAAGNESERLQKSLHEERARGQRLEQELVQTRHDLELQAALTAGNDSGELKQAAKRDLQELQKVAQQERDRASRSEQTLTVARRELETQSALVTKTSAEAISAKEAAETALVELQKTFQQERNRAKRLEEDLATMQYELENRSLQIAKANEEMAQIRRTAENSVAKLRLSLEEEHERAEGLAQEFSLTRTKLFAHEAQAAANNDGAKEMQELLRQERDRSGRLEQELATAHRILETSATAGKSSEEAAGMPPPWARLLGLSLQPFQQSLRDVAATPNKAKAPSPSLSVVTAGEVGRVPPIETQTTGSVQPAAVPSTAKLEHEHTPELIWLTARATGLLGQGDIGAARAVLERAAELGSAQAHFALAETYDPNVLARWGAYGTRSDATKARELYAKAEAKGIREAKERVDALGQ